MSEPRKIEVTLRQERDCERLLTHEEFLQQYVLNRATAHVGGLDGDGAVVQGEGAWKKIGEIVGRG
jgi:hypothetical protein